MFNSIQSSINTVSLSSLLTLLYIGIITRLLYGLRRGKQVVSYSDVGFAIYLSIVNVEFSMDRSRTMYCNKKGLRKELSYFFRRYKRISILLKMLLVTLIYQLLLIFT